MKSLLLAVILANPQQSYLSRFFSPENLPTVGLLVAGIAGIAVAIATLNHMRESSERQLRAYVLPDNAGLFEGSMMVPPQLARTNIPGVAMLVKNSGQTPAYKVISFAQIAVIAVANETTLIVPPIPQQFSLTLGPGATFNKAFWLDRALTPNEIADIQTGVRAVYLYGRIDHRDAFEKPRFTNFRLRYFGAFPPPPNAILLFCETGNDAN
jgi:hypothetical protein